MDTPLATYCASEPLDRLKYLQQRHIEVLLRPALAWGLIHQIADYTAVAVWQPSSEAIRWPSYNAVDKEVADFFDETEEAYVA